MFSEKSKTIFLILLSFLLLLAGSAYFLFLQCIFPSLVPGYGGARANDTLELYVDGDYVCDCSHYELVIEGGDEALILLRSDSPVKGKFTARQEIPLEHQLLAFVILLSLIHI